MRGAPPTDGRAAAYQSIIHRRPLGVSYQISIFTHTALLLLRLAITSARRW